MVPFFGMIYFGGMHAASKWMLTQVCKPIYDSGGQALWAAALDCIIFAVATMQVVFIGVLLVRSEEEERSLVHHDHHHHHGGARSSHATLGGAALYAYMVPLPIATFLFWVQMRMSWLPEGATLPLDEARRLDGIEVTFDAGGTAAADDVLDHRASTDIHDEQDEQGGGGGGDRARKSKEGRLRAGSSPDTHQIAGSSALRMECNANVVASMGAVRGHTSTIHISVFAWMIDLPFYFLYIYSPQLASMPIDAADRPSGLTLNVHTVRQPRIDMPRLRFAARTQGPAAAYHTPSLLVQIETKLGSSKLVAE